MTNPRGQICYKSLAVFIWLQNFQRCISSRYNIDLEEMDFLASNLSPHECYDFYNQLSHRRAIRGGISIYAQKEKARQLSCIHLLATWLTDPEESSFRSHENIELKLRNIGRKDLARWIVEKIESSLQRKTRLNDEQVYLRQIEDSERNQGEKIMPIVSFDNHEIGTESENIGINDKDNSCIFSKIFLSVLVVLMLILLFLCFYKFLYTKLRCICHRFDSSDGRKYCLHEENYGTASSCNFQKEFENLSEKSLSKINFKHYSDETLWYNFRKENQLFNQKKRFNSPSEKILTWERNGRKKFNKIDSERISNRCFSDDQLSSKESTKNRTRDKKMNFYRNFEDEKEKWTLCSCNLISESERKNSSNSNNFCSIESIKNSKLHQGQFGKTIEMPTEFQKEKCRKKMEICENNCLNNWPNISSASSEISSIKKPINSELQTKERAVSQNEKCSEFQQEKCNKKIEISQEKYFNDSRNISSASSEINSMKNPKNSELRHLESSEFHLEKWKKPMEIGANNNVNYLRGDAESEMSATYDELGMLFSEEMKRQWRPCRRNYCPLSRNLRTSGKLLQHDEMKCRRRYRANFGYKVIRIDERPACSSAEICRDTYDEFELMKATKEQLEEVARSIVERRKRFLDQPCLSPISTT